MHPVCINMLVWIVLKSLPYDSNDIKDKPTLSLNSETICFLVISSSIQEKCKLLEY